ncbi:hypothetical protein BTVI_29671 [Pitangus sulphuratus]|nr:hypothetical protein BTVI_29671 [Pitangus sulphuratus]
MQLLSEAKLCKEDISDSASLKEASQPLLWGSVFETDGPVLLSNVNPNSSVWNVISLGQSRWAETLQPEMFRNSLDSEIGHRKQDNIKNKTKLIYKVMPVETKCLQKSNVMISAQVNFNTSRHIEEQRQGHQRGLPASFFTRFHSLIMLAKFESPILAQEHLKSWLNLPNLPNLLIANL